MTSSSSGPTARIEPGAFGSDIGRGLRGDEVLAADEEEVRRVDGGGLDLDQHLAGPRCGRLEVDQLQDIGGLADRGDLKLARRSLSRYVGISPV